MAHFAELDKNNIVKRIIVVDNTELKDPVTGQEVELLGQSFCKRLFGGDWIQTSISGSIRKRYAGVGFYYDKSLDAFIPPKPHEDWILDENTLDWNPPKEKPEVTHEQEDLGEYYVWDESSQDWKLISQ